MLARLQKRTEWRTPQNQMFECSRYPSGKILLQCRVNDFWSCKQGSFNMIQSLWGITMIFAGVVDTTASNTVTGPSWKWASTYCQWFLALHLGSSNRWLVVIMYIQLIGGMVRQNNALDVHCPIVKMRSKEGSMIVNLRGQLIKM